MVCNSKDLSEWKDFPKGLRVLLLDGNPSACSDISSRLLSMDYIVTVFRDVSEALSAVSSFPENFHVAIVDVVSDNGDDMLKFLDVASELPTVMISDIHCINTMMKCIALGAVEFLKKPVSDDKLRNIWQHVVHKAFNSGGSEAFKPVKDSVASMLKLAEVKDEQGDKFPAPSTPQIEQGKFQLEDTICSSEQEGESKFVETKEGKKGKPSRKKMKVDWTAELHKKFVLAVDHLGVDQAIPSRILEHMKVEGLTRHNVASHLQKYRMHRRSILPKTEDRRLPVMAYPTWNYSVWGHQQPPFWVPPWAGYQGNAWGCPVVPVPRNPPPCVHVAEGGFSEVVDGVVQEVMNKPWLPLPLGLKPPSTESVLAELSRHHEKT